MFVLSGHCLESFLVRRNFRLHNIKRNTETLRNIMEKIDLYFDICVQIKLEMSRTYQNARNAFWSLIEIL